MCGLLVVVVVIFLGQQHPAVFHSTHFLLVSLHTKADTAVLHRQQLHVRRARLRKCSDLYSGSPYCHFLRTDARIREAEQRDSTQK